MAVKPPRDASINPDPRRSIGHEPLVECVPNFSEGRRAEVIEALISVIAGVPGVTLLDHEMDADHNRSVLTFAGEPEPVIEAAVRAAREPPS